MCIKVYLEQSASKLYTIWSKVTTESVPINVHFPGHLSFVHIHDPFSQMHSLHFTGIRSPFLDFLYFITTRWRSLRLDILKTFLRRTNYFDEYKDIPFSRCIFRHFRRVHQDKHTLGNSPKYNKNPKYLEQATDR